MPYTIPEYIEVKATDGNTVAFLSPESDGVEAWIDDEQNGSCTIEIELPTENEKWQYLTDKYRIHAGDKEFVILNPDAVDKQRDGKKLTGKIKAHESWVLLGKKYQTISNDPQNPSPPWGAVIIVSGGAAHGGFEAGSAGSALSYLLQGTGWTVGTVDVTGTYDLETEKESVLYNINQVQEKWGGILIWDSVNKTVSLRDEETYQPYTGYQIRYAKNLKGINRVDDYDIVTRLYPFGENDLNIEAVNSGLLYLDNHSYSDDILEGVWYNQDIADQAQLKVQGEKQLAVMCRPRHNYKTEVLDLRSLPGYGHETFKRSDMVDLLDEDFGVNARVRIIRYRHNVFQPWLCDMELGDPIEKIQATVAQTVLMAKFYKNVVAPNTSFQNLLKAIINTEATEINGASGDYTLVDGVSTWFDRDDVTGELTGKLLRITPQGLIISYDGGQTWKLAISGEGFHADAGWVGKLNAGVVTIGAETTFAEGYDPSKIVAGSTVGMGVDADCLGLWHFDGSLNSHKGVAADSDALFGGGCFGQALSIATGKKLKVPTTGMEASTGTINFRAKNLAESVNGSVLVDLPKSDNTQGIIAGISNVAGHEGEVYVADSPKVSKSYIETTQADFNSGTLTDVTATSAGDLELATTMGKALSFDGVDDYVEVIDNSALSFSGDFTIEATINIAHLNQASSAVLTKRGTSAKAIYAFWVRNTGQISYQVYDNGRVTGGNAITTKTVTAGQQHHITLRRLGSTVQVLIDGELDNSSVTCSGIISPPENLFFGKHSISTTQFFPGIIDDVRIWNVARTQQQIQDNMNKELAGNETGLVGYWKLNEGTGTTAYDSTASSNNGTIYGATWETSGTREKIVDLSGANPAGGTKIEWSSTTPTGTDVKVETALSTDGGSTYGAYQEATSGSSIPDITAQTDLTNARLKIKETLSTTDTSVTPRLHSLTFSILESAAAYGPNKSTLTAWDSIALAWKPDRLSLVVNDSEVAYIENPGLPASLGSHVYIGTDRNGNNAINTLVDELRIDKVYRDVNIRTGWHKTGVPFYTSEDMKQWPGYLRAETDGLKVYDSLNNLRVLVGSWLRDAVRKYGIKIIDGEIYSSIIRSGAEDATTYIQLTPPSTLQIVKSQKILLSIDTTAAHGRVEIFNDKGLDCGQLGGANDRDLGLMNVSGKLFLIGQTGVECMYGINVTGGTKNCIEDTIYGRLAISARESPEVRYVDEGMGTLVYGECRIDVDPIFLECIEPHTPDSRWYVTLTPYADVDLYVSEIGDGYFVVKERKGGTSTGAEFTWSLSATRKDYALIRFMEVLD